MNFAFTLFLKNNQAYEKNERNQGETAEPPYNDPTLWFAKHYVFPFKQNTRSHFKFLFENEWGNNKIKSKNLLNVLFIHSSRVWKDQHQASLSYPSLEFL